MPHCTDKQTIERLLVPAMLQVVVTMVQRGLEENAGALDGVTQHLAQALREPVEGLSSGKVAKLVRRAKRVTEEAMVPLKDQLVGIQLLAVAQFAASLTERDILVVGAESPFARAWDLIAEVLDCAWDELHQDERASQTAREMSARLAALGYFRQASI
jgi:hypothetical protein